MTKTMRWANDRRAPLSMLAAVLLPLGVAALLVPFRASFADAAAALILVAVVTLVAVPGTRMAGYVAALSASLWFDFFLTRPYERLVIDQRPDIEITVSLFVVGVLITELAARSRRNYRHAREESSYVDRIYQVSEFVAAGGSIDEVVTEVRAELIELLHLRDCRFERGGSFERMNEIGRNGHVALGPIAWPVGDWGLPGPQIALMVLSRGRVVGRFVLTPSSGQGVSLKRRLVAVAIVDQVGSLLVRHLHAA